MKKLLKSEIYGPVTKKLVKSWLKCATKVAEVCTIHTMLSQQSRHGRRRRKKKKKAETRESPDVDAKHINNPMKTHT